MRRREAVRWQVQLAAAYGREKLHLGRGGVVTLKLGEVPLRAYRPYYLDFLVREIFTEGAYDIGPLPDRPVIIDCGANIGIASVYFSLTYPGCHLMAFEPDPVAFDLLTQNTATLTDFQALNLAVGAKKGALDFFTDEGKPGSARMSGIRERQPNGTLIVVDCVRLSSLLPEHVDLLKIDVEGMEWAILDDLEESGAFGTIDRMVIEYHHHLPLSANRLAEFLTRIERAGFAYEIGAERKRGRLDPMFQDVMIYAYRHSETPDFVAVEGE
jgi:FkbM family methyltransferase